MTNYFKGGKGYGDGNRPAPEAMREMGEDINTKLSGLLVKHNPTIEGFRQRSPEVVEDDAAAMSYLNDYGLGSWEKSLTDNRRFSRKVASPKPGPSRKSSAPGMSSKRPPPSTQPKNRLPKNKGILSSQELSS